MIDREKVIKGLEEVQHYIKIENLPAHTLKAKLVIDDAIALLKAQEPRVMTWDEVKAWHEIDEIDRDPIFVEYRYEKAFGPSRWYISRFGIGAMSDDEKKVYNKYIRCWTSRPYQATREMTPWN